MDYSSSFNSIKVEQEEPTNDADNELFEEGCCPRRKQSHIVAEQKRRDAIKRGYDHLQSVVPGCKNNDINIAKSQSKISQAQVLQKSLDHMKLLISQKQQQDEEVNALEKEVKGLQIMKENYEQLVKTSQPQIQESNEVTDEEKLVVFLKIIESMWLTFKDAVSLTTFQLLSSSIFGWLENYCKPHILKETVVNSLKSTFSNKNN